MIRLALLIPVNTHGQVLLQHKDSAAPFKPNHWTFFGGSIEDGETPEDAAIREFKEELQRDIGKQNIGKLNFFGKYVFDEEWGRLEKTFFVIFVNEGSETLKVDQLEGDNLGFFNYSNSSRLDVSLNDRKVLEDAFKRGFLNLF